MRKTAFAFAAAMILFAGATAADARPSRESDGEHWNPFVQYSASVVDSRATAHRSKRRVASKGRAQRVAQQKRAYRVRYASRGEADAGTASYERHEMRRARRHVSSSSSYTGSSYRGGVGARPRAWCGWWMRTQRGGGPEMNLAWNWSRWGRPSGPQVGAVVVWRHHVGEIVGRSSNGQWLVRSGNDGGAVRTRARSVAGAVFRMG